MGEMITKPDANPILFAVLNLFTLGCVGYIILGQQKKGIATLVYALVTSCFGLGWIFVLLATYDVYLLGQKLQSGESIGVSENGLDFLGNLPGFS